jgi:hypothetical protein
MTTTRTKAAALRRAALALSLLAPAACETGYVIIAPDVGAATKPLGPTEGSASSHLGVPWPVWAPVFCFIPYGWDDRAPTAYREAVAGVPGATALADVTIQEDWIWWAVGTSRKLTVRGQAVKP